MTNVGAKPVASKHGMRPNRRHGVVASDGATRRPVARTASATASATLLGAIAGYRLVVSPWLPSRCRFAPSCSAYAAEAIRRHGPLVGVRLAAARIARCHPWHPGGHDPVPDTRERG